MKKAAKTPKRGKQHQNIEKNNKKEQEDRTINTARSQYIPKPKGKKKADEKSNRLRGTGNFRCENSVTTKQCKIGINKMSKKPPKTNKQHRQKE